MAANSYKIENENKKKHIHTTANIAMFTYLLYIPMARYIQRHLWASQVFYSLELFLPRFYVSGCDTSLVDHEAVAATVETWMPPPSWWTKSCRNLVYNLVFYLADNDAEMLNAWIISQLWLKLVLSKYVLPKSTTCHYRLFEWDCGKRWVWIISFNTSSDEYKLRGYITSSV